MKNVLKESINYAFFKKLSLVSGKFLAEEFLALTKCSPPTFSLTFNQRGRRHLRFIFSSQFVDNSDAGLIVRHFSFIHTFPSISEMEFIERRPTLSLIASPY